MNWDRYTVADLVAIATSEYSSLERKEYKEIVEALASKYFLLSDKYNKLRSKIDCTH